MKLRINTLNTFILMEVVRVYLEDQWPTSHMGPVTQNSVQMFRLADDPASPTLIAYEVVSYLSGTDNRN